MLGMRATRSTLYLALGTLFIEPERPALSELVDNVVRVRVPRACR